jgi:hypothetical protein
MCTICPFILYVLCSGKWIMIAIQLWRQSSSASEGVLWKNVDFAVKCLAVSPNTVSFHHCVIFQLQLWKTHCLEKITTNAFAGIWGSPHREFLPWLVKTVALKSSAIAGVQRKQPPVADICAWACYLTGSYWLAIGPLLKGEMQDGFWDLLFLYTTTIFVHQPLHSVWWSHKSLYPYLTYPLELYCVSWPMCAHTNADGVTACHLQVL